MSSTELSVANQQEDSRLLASDVFGGREALTDMLLANIREKLSNGSQVVLQQSDFVLATNSLDFFSQFTRSELLEFLWIHDISVESVMPTVWNKGDGMYEYWRNEFLRRGNELLTVIGESAFEEAEGVLMHLFICMEALNEVCRTHLPVNIDPRMTQLRNKYRKILEEIPE